MPALFSDIGIIGKPRDPRVKSTVASLARHLQAQSIRVRVERQTHELLQDGNCEPCDMAQLRLNCDLLIVVGGDGTLLGAARNLAAGGPPLLGVNLGRLGFLVDISPDQMLAAVDRTLAGEYQEESRFLLQAGIGPTPDRTESTPAFNDVVLHKWNTPRMVEFETYIDGRFVNSQRSDGLIVSTPTGSTAYALSGGGPLLHPSLNAILLVPICPHTLSNRPIVVSSDSQVEIRISGEDHAHSRVSCDGQADLPIGAGDNIYIARHPQPVRLLHPRGHDHFKILRAKLGWGGHPSL
jgi:NAD+ kinase